jgi:hypothetical protein
MSDAGDLRLYVTDSEVRQAFDDAYRVDPFYLPSEPVLPSGIQGFCLCRGRSRAPLVAFHCFPYAKNRRWRREKILRVTRVLHLRPGKALPPEAAAALLREIRDIADRAGARSIEVEAYREIRTPIFFPSGSSAVNAYNDAGLIPLLGDAGFQCFERRVCCGVSSCRFGPETVEGHSSLRFRPYDPESGSDRELYYRLWTESGDCPYDLADNGLWRVNAFGWPRAWYAELPPALSRPGTILFAERDGEPLGFVHWWPNVYPALRAGGRKALYPDEECVTLSPGIAEEGKIFKLVVGRNGERVRERIERALLLEGVRVMREEFGIRRLQVGNVAGHRAGLLSFLAAQGAEKAQEIWIMRKSYSLFDERPGVP